MDLWRSLVWESHLNVGNFRSAEKKSLKKKLNPPPIQLVKIIFSTNFIWIPWRGNGKGKLMTASWEEHWKTFGCSLFQSCLRSSGGSVSVTVIPLRVFSHQDMGSFQLVQTIRLIMGCYVASCGAASGTFTIGELFWPGGKFALISNWKGFSFYCGALRLDVVRACRCSNRVLKCDIRKVVFSEK